jgi:hypothetical protein
MATPVSYPLVNGVFHSFASIELKVDGVIYAAVKAVNYKQSLTPTKVRGAHAEPLGRTRGDLEADGDIELYEQQGFQLLSQLGDGYLEKVFSITVTYSENGLDTITDEIVQVRIQEVDKSNAQGTDASSIKFTLNIMKIKLNGLEPLLNPLSGATVQQ